MTEVATRSRAPRLVALLGPAVVAGVAYLDPGNVASNTSAGARYGYLLVWVVVVANVMAWLVQYLSAKLGLSTGQSLPELIGRSIRSPFGRVAFWVQAEIVAMATDVAEVIGGAIALELLFGVPLVIGGLVVGAVSLTLLAVRGRAGSRVFEFIVVGLVLVIAVGFCVGVAGSSASASGVLSGLVPHFAGTGSVLLAASIMGATVMPHAIYAHSSLTRDRFGRVSETERPRILRVTRIDVTVALGVAGTVNVLMVVLAAATLRGVVGTNSLQGAYVALHAALGPVIAALFAIGLLASGLASTSVGAYAGAEITSGLLRVRMPVVVQRVITLVPALVILAVGVDPTVALISTQLVLSFGIPFALVPLVVYTSRASLLGSAVNRRRTTVLAAAVATLLVALNVSLIVLVLGG